MTQFSTGYCVACETQVTGDRESAEDGLGPDGRLYCGECMTAMRLFQEQRHAGTLAAGAGEAGSGSPGAGFAAGTSGGSRPAAKAPRPAARARSAGTPRRGGAPAGRWAAVAGVALAILGGGTYFALNPGAPRSAPPVDPGSAIAPDPGGQPAGATETPGPVPGRPPKRHPPGPDDGLEQDLPKPAAEAAETPWQKVEKVWNAAQKSLDRSRMREGVRAILAFDAAGDAAAEQSRGELLGAARRAWFDAERPWIESQLAAIDRREGRAGARAYLDRVLTDARDLFDESQVRALEGLFAALAGAEEIAAGPEQPSPDPAGSGREPELPREPERAPEPERTPEPEPDPPARGDEVLAADDTAGILAAEGKDRTVEGKVLRAEAAKSGKIFWISFGKEKGSFQAVIFARALEAFEKEHGDLGKALVGRIVQVRGTVAIYQERPQIVLEQPSQLTLR